MKEEGGRMKDELTEAVGWSEWAQGHMSRLRKWNAICNELLDLVDGNPSDEGLEAAPAMAARRIAELEADIARLRRAVDECGSLVDFITTAAPHALSPGYTYEDLVGLGHRLAALRGEEGDDASD